MPPIPIVPTVRNLLRSLPPPGADESFESLLERPGVRVERIVSHGHATPPGQWYDQVQDEWVVVLAGAACLVIEGQGGERELELGPFDAVFLPAHCRHRVSATDPEQPTVWLAVHCGGD
jgi:cupin 2 domain-containing protein